MSVWTLARSGHSGALSLGQSRGEILEIFGEPTDIAQHIYKYDAIELHFADGALWLIHCEFGERPLHRGARSPLLGIQPDGLEWPLDGISLATLARSRGFESKVVRQSSGDEVRFELASAQIHDGDGFASWSVRPSQLFAADDQLASGDHQSGTVPFENFREAAIEWSGTAYGKPLVEAAVTALLARLDTPTLRVLAGAPQRFADEEASKYAVEVFDELGLRVPENLSSDAFVGTAKLKAKNYLEAGGSAAHLAGEVSALHVLSGYRSELGDLAALSEWYAINEQGLVQGDASSLDDEVRIEAERLVAGLPSRGRRVGDPYMATIPSKKPLVERLKKWLNFKVEDG